MDKANQPALTPANVNPWFVLMPLYGEQDGDEIDAAFDEKNRKVWNAWAGRHLTSSKIEVIASAIGVFFLGLGLRNRFRLK